MSETSKHFTKHGFLEKPDMCSGCGVLFKEIEETGKWVDGERLCKDCTARRTNGIPQEGMEETPF
jgi:hypothetical protein